jgi:hypothetical protein
LSRGKNGAARQENQRGAGRSEVENLTHGASARQGGGEPPIGVIAVSIPEIQTLLAMVEALAARVEALAHSLGERPSAEPEPERIYLPPEAFAKRVGVSVRTLRSMRKRGLPWITAGLRHVRIPVAEAERWLASRGGQP